MSEKIHEYENDGINYIKIGGFGTDCLEYQIQKDGSVYLPEIEKYYSSLEKACIEENRAWCDWYEKEMKNN